MVLLMQKKAENSSVKVNKVPLTPLNLANAKVKKIQ